MSITNGWDVIDDSGSGNKVEFLKLAEGITYIQLIDAVPTPRWTHWMPSLNRSLTCTGKGCPICEIRKAEKANGEKPTNGIGRRFSMSAINDSNGKVEILDQGKTFMEDLRDLALDVAKEGKDIRGYKLKIKRRGMDTSTSYRIDLDEEVEISKLEPINLVEYFAPPTNEQVLRILNGEKIEDVMKREDNDKKDENIVLA